MFYLYVYAYTSVCLCLPLTFRLKALSFSLFSPVVYISMSVSVCLCTERLPAKHMPYCLAQASAKHGGATGTAPSAFSRAPPEGSAARRPGPWLRWVPLYWWFSESSETSCARSGTRLSHPCLLVLTSSLHASQTHVLGCRGSLWDSVLSKTFVTPRPRLPAAEVTHSIQKCFCSQAWSDSQTKAFTPTKLSYMIYYICRICNIVRPLVLTILLFQNQPNTSQHRSSSHIHDRILDYSAAIFLPLSSGRHFHLIVIRDRHVIALSTSMSVLFSRDLSR